MNRKNIIRVLVVFIIIVSNIYLLFSFSRNTKKLYSCINTIKLEKNKNIDLQNYFIEREKRSNESIGKYIPLSIPVIRTSGKEHLLSNLLRSSYTLFFRYNENSCQLCVKTEIKRIMKNLGHIDKDKIVILASGENIRDINYFKEINNFDLNFFLIERKKLNISLEQFDMPYVFLLTQEGLVQSVFIPELKEEKLSNNYYKKMEKLLGQLDDVCEIKNFDLL